MKLKKVLLVVLVVTLLISMSAAVSAGAYRGSRSAVQTKTVAAVASDAQSTIYTPYCVYGEDCPYDGQCQVSCLGAGQGTGACGRMGSGGCGRR